MGQGALLRGLPGPVCVRVLETACPVEFPNLYRIDKYEYSGERARDPPGDLRLPVRKPAPAPIQGPLHPGERPELSASFSLEDEGRGDQEHSFCGPSEGSERIWLRRNRGPDLQRIAEHGLLRLQRREHPLRHRCAAGAGLRDLEHQQDAPHTHHRPPGSHRGPAPAPEGGQGPPGHAAGDPDRCGGGRFHARLEAEGDLPIPAPYHGPGVLRPGLRGGLRRRGSCAEIDRKHRNVPLGRRGGHEGHDRPGRVRRHATALPVGQDPPEPRILPRNEHHRYRRGDYRQFPGPVGFERDSGSRPRTTSETSTCSGLS